MKAASSDRAISAPTQEFLGSAGIDREPEQDKVLPLPGWLTKLYFVFPVILYIPDAIFNAYVYSDGWDTSGASPLLQVGKVALVSVLALGVVGMAYLLSVLAPWHWGQGHHIQAFFCAVGVVIATAVTIWNSLAYRSGSFVEFKTDQWAYNLWPELASSHISVTMLLVSIAPPFWGLFWAIVQPTATGRSLRQLQESHAEKLMRVQHEAEVKRLKAETSAKVREAQLRGMARTAAAAREQAGQVLRRKQTSASASGGFETSEAPAPDELAAAAVEHTTTTRMEGSPTADDLNNLTRATSPHPQPAVPTSRASRRTRTRSVASSTPGTPDRSDHHHLLASSPAHHVESNSEESDVDVAITSPLAHGQRPVHVQAPGHDVLGTISRHDASRVG